MHSQKITVYRPNQRHEQGLIHTWTIMMRNVWQSRELIWQLFKRDFFAQYKKSFLGLTWIVLMPLFGIISWVFLQMTGVLRPGEVGIPYPAYVLIGTSMWGFFIGLYTSSSQTLEAGRSMIMQVNYPHEAMLFKEMGQQAASFTIILTLNLFVLILLRIFQPGGFSIAFPNAGILLFPFVILPLFFLAGAMGLIMSMVHIVAVDLSRAVTMVLGLLMYVTPVIYSAESIENPLSQAIIKWNPLTYLVCSARDVLIYGHIYQHNYLAYFISAVFSLIAFLIAWRLFYVSELTVVERII